MLVKSKIDYDYEGDPPLLGATARQATRTIENTQALTARSPTLRGVPLTFLVR